MDDEPRPAPRRKAPKLTASQRDALLLAAYGAPKVRTLFGGPCFVMADPPRGSNCPTLPQPTATFRALQRLGLVDYPNPREEGAITLSAAGVARFEEEFAPEVRAALDAWKERRRKDAVQDRARQLRDRLMGDEHRMERVRRRRDEMHDLVDEAHRAKCRVTALALQIGDGANDVDGLLQELRAETRRLREAEARQAALDVETRAEAKADEARIEAAVREAVPEAFEEGDGTA